MNEDKLESAINRAAQAESLMRNELLTEAFVNLEESYIAKMLTTGPLEGEVREKLYLAINIARKVRDHLGKIIADGKLAQTELNMRQTKPR